MQAPWQMAAAVEVAASAAAHGSPGFFPYTEHRLASGMARGPPNTQNSQMDARPTRQDVMDRNFCVVVVVDRRAPSCGRSELRASAE